MRPGRIEASRTLLGAGLPAPFAIPGFGGLWVSSAAGAFARVVTQLALSWVTLETTGSPFLVGVVMAVRMAPQLVLGIPAGALADWLDRRRLIVGVNAAGALVLAALVALSAGGLLSTVVLIAVSAAYGTMDTVRTAATQAYAYDLVRTSRATSGMALVNLGVQLTSTLGGLAGGYALAELGAPTTFAMVGGAVLLAAIAPLLLSPPAPAPGARSPDAHPPDAPQHAARAEAGPPPATPARRRPRPSVRQAMTLILRNRMLAVLSASIIVAEIFGFATQTLLPTFARDVFDVGAAGFGTMMAVRSGGGALGLLLLARLGTEGRSGVVFVGGAAVYGLALLLFAVSPTYAVALVFLTIGGMGASVMDTLGQTLVQRHADERERGAAMGLWVFSVGFGPVGHLALGAAASSFGAPSTQIVSGALLILAAGTMALHRPLFRAR